MVGGKDGSAKMLHGRAIPHTYYSHLQVYKFQPIFGNTVKCVNVMVLILTCMMVHVS